MALHPYSPAAAIRRVLDGRLSKADRAILEELLEAGLSQTPLPKALEAAEKAAAAATLLAEAQVNPPKKRTIKANRRLPRVRLPYTVFQSFDDISYLLESGRMFAEEETETFFQLTELLPVAEHRSFLQAASLRLIEIGFVPLIVVETKAQATALLEGEALAAAVHHLDSRFKSEAIPGEALRHIASQETRARPGTPKFAFLVMPSRGLTALQGLTDFFPEARVIAIPPPLKAAHRFCPKCAENGRLKELSLRLNLQGSLTFRCRYDPCRWETTACLYPFRPFET